jgi:glucosamine--fructose-6-phosphate aminotransferase (isomerizing)
MCGIVGAISNRNVDTILMEGLRRLEYRGYDSAGIAIIEKKQINRIRRAGKVKKLQDALDQNVLSGKTGISHTRWATHGIPSENNAHPHLSDPDFALVHNGIIENYNDIKNNLIDRGYKFTSDTDTEAVVHLIHSHFDIQKDLLMAVKATIQELEGAYALAVISTHEPEKIVVARSGCPVVIGVGENENFVASDVAALLMETNEFMFLEEGDVAVVEKENITVIDAEDNEVKRKVTKSRLSSDAAEKGEFEHFMLKEIYEQSRAIANTLDQRISDGKVLQNSFGPQAEEVFNQVEAIHIVACGTSFHAGLIAKYWIESMCRIPCRVEIASEYRYRNPVVMKNTLFVVISQSGETADTLAALRAAKEAEYISTLTICNVPESTMVRESDLVMLTKAGPEIGVASTKAFTTQLSALSLLTIVIGRRFGLDEEKEKDMVNQLLELPTLIDQILVLNEDIKELAKNFADKHHALFLGRGVQNPVAMEGALKLKEISYIHAEAYAAGELKHGPLALVDEDMPVVAVAPDDQLLEKLRSNLQEVKARGGELYVFSDPRIKFVNDEVTHSMLMPIAIKDFQGPILYSIPLQLLAYHVAVIKGTDIDQPRNLAKSVTVE